MNRQQVSLLSILWHNSHPGALLSGILLYTLGGGVARFLGFPIQWTDYWIGQGCITLLQLASYFLKAYFEFPKSLELEQKKNKTDNGRDTQPTFHSRITYLQISLTLLAVGGMLTALLFSRGIFTLPMSFIFGMVFVISFFYGVPPLRLVYSGYGELTQAILITNLTPALAFIIQTNELHRMLAMTTFPLTILYIAMTLALSLPEYAGDLKYGRRTLLLRLGWQHGMTLHNLLILTSYLLLVLASLLGLPWALTWPGLLALPIGLFQIFQIFQIASGAKPRWKLLILTAMSTFLLTSYLLSFALWTR